MNFVRESCLGVTQEVVSTLIGQKKFTDRNQDDCMLGPR